MDVERKTRNCWSALRRKTRRVGQFELLYSITIFARVNIGSLGVRAGVSINPATPVKSLVLIIDEIDLVLVMSVNPGFGGQSFIENTFEKVKELNLALDKYLLEHKNQNNEFVSALYQIDEAYLKIAIYTEIINEVKNAKMEIYDISTDEGNLEDVFIDLTKS